MPVTSYNHPAAASLFDLKLIPSFEQSARFLHMVAAQMRPVTAMTVVKGQTSRLPLPHQRGSLRTHGLSTQWPFAYSGSGCR
jgi:hypothetical protein